MSKIQTIQPKYQPSVLGQKKTNSNNPSFASGATMASDAYEVIGNKAIAKTEEVVNKRLGLSGKLYQKLSDTQGELQNQLISNIFTATLAPAVIAWNPISKDDQNTKYYMAWRQPISAAIAMGINFPLTMLANNYFNKIASEGTIKSLDIRMCPDKAGSDYLKPQFKKVLKAEKDKGTLKEFMAACNDKSKIKYNKSDMFNSNGKPTNAYKKACYDGYVEKLKADSKDLFTPLYGEKPENIVFKNGVISVKDPDGTLKEINKNIPSFEEEKDLTAFLDQHNVYKKSTRDFMKEEFNFEFFEDGKVKPDILNDRLDKTKGMDFMRKFGLYESGKSSEADLKELVSKIRGQKLENGLEKVFVDGVWRSKESAKTLTAELGKAISRNAQNEVGQEASLKEAISLKQLFHSLGYKTKDGSLQTLMNKSMAEAQADIMEKIKGKGINDLDNKTIRDFAKNVLSTNAERVGKNFGNYKKYFGIAINLPILAITCTALNWAYPRVMEACFPNLTNAKKKGGNK